MAVWQQKSQFSGKRGVKVQAYCLKTDGKLSAVELEFDSLGHLWVVTEIAAGTTSVEFIEDVQCDAVALTPQCGSSSSSSAVAATETWRTDAQPSGKRGVKVRLLCLNGDDCSIAVADFEFDSLGHLISVTEIVTSLQKLWILTDHRCGTKTRKQIGISAGACVSEACWVTVDCCPSGTDPVGGKKLNKKRRVVTFPGTYNCTARVGAAEDCCQ